ncbi:9-hexadecenoic acid cis-trans isomerase [Alteromonas confluentis]|uniref:9-hexadecenoic acid cis-trans isomerase n=1 Tax=Alteromonas confluentis TaxID=1656094 RepID=A0A1E7Z6Z4_9ALTE|nr:9-hexadecenoic acid cis-trans isomerase [Alteromonas confluentis]
MLAILGLVIAVAIWQWEPQEAPLLNDSTTSESMKPLSAGFFDQHVEPVLTQRCVVCHACYDAPCQLKMSSAEGLARGANKEKVYQGTRLTAATPNRLFIDAQNVDEWRQRDFFTVLPETVETEDSPPPTQSSVLAQMLLLKQANPLPETTHLGEGFDISLNRPQQCPTLDEMGSYIAEQPLGGMPYALPGLTNEEQQTLMRWLHNGAPLPKAQPLPDALLKRADKFEAWLNGNSNKAQLSARYIYEHLFTSHLYFEALSEEGVTPQFFNLVRSLTPPGEPLDVVATRRPFDHPGTDRVWYRLQPVTSTIVSKTHQPYAINDDLMAKWNAWFVEAEFDVPELPSYKPEVAANPLTAFTLMPVNTRYRFMLERAQNTIMGYIKGPVCRGQVALNVINDRFWVFFVDPEVATSEKLNRFYASQKENLHLPAEQESTALAVSWVKYAEHQGDYLRARTDFMNDTFRQGQHLSLKSIWDGDGNNTNATLTVFRHFDNATVAKGLVGEPTKTAWVIDYALLERIHYLLVAGFDVYGNYGHQLMTRLYMDFLRMEGESNFLALLPPQTRHQQLSEWYQQAGPELTDFIEGDINSFEQDTGIEYSSDNPKSELYSMLKQALENVQPKSSSLRSNWLSDDQLALLGSLDTLSPEQATILPEITMLMVRPDNGEGEPEMFTLLRNSAHYNVSSLFEEDENRNYGQDSVTLVQGLLGSYPDVFWQINASEVQNMVAKVKRIKSESDYEAFITDYGVRRTNPAFWQFSDEVIQWALSRYPIEGGLLDYNRLEDR